MARNRDKRPGTDSGSASSGQGKPGDAGAKSAVEKTQAAGDDKSAQPQSAANRALAAKLENPQASKATAASTTKAPDDKVTTASPAKAAASSAATASSSASSASSSSSKVTSPSASGTTKAVSDARMGSQASASKPDVTAARSGGAGSAAPKATGSTPAGAAGGSQHGSGSSGGGGFWPGLLGGAVGGGIAAFVISYVLMGDQRATMADLQSRLTAAEQQFGDVGALDERIAAVEAVPDAVSGLTARLDDLDSTLAATPDSDVTARLSDLETGLAELGAAAPAVGGDDLDERLTSLQLQVEALASDVQSAGEARRADVQTLASLSDALPALQETLAATGETVSQTGEQTTALGESVDTLSGDVQTLVSRVDAAEGRLDHLGGAYQRGAAMVVAIGDIERAIARAEPFDDILQSLRSLVRDDTVIGGSLSVLEPMAADGVPTLSMLKSSFGPMASRVMLAEEGDQTIVDRVGSNVFGIINMRPAGADAEGSSSRAVLARAQSKLSGDDLDGALTELAMLEGNAAEEAKSWIENAKGRLSAEAAVIDLRSHAQGLVAKGA